MSLLFFERKSNFGDRFSILFREKKMSRFLGRFGLLSFLLSLAACTPPMPQPKPQFRTIEVRPLDAKGRMGDAFSMSASYSPDEDAVQLSAILPGGEKFTGTLIQGRQVGYSFSPPTRIYQPPIIGGNPYYPTYSYSPSITIPHTQYDLYGKAMLLGSEAHTLVCQFTFAKPFLGPFSGGFGECSLSDGQKFNLIF